MLNIISTIAQDKLILGTGLEKTWQLRLQTPGIPDGFLILSRINWENQLIPKTESNVKTFGEMLIVEYGPIEQKIPSGKYTWELTLLSEIDTTNRFPFSKEFYIGTPSQKQRETRESSQFYQNIIQQVLLLAQEIQNTKATSKVPIQEMFPLLQNWYSRCQKINNQFQQYQKEFWFLTDAQSFKETRNILRTLEILVIVGTYQFTQQTPVPWDPELPQKIGKLAFNEILKKISESFEQINRESKKILSRLSIPENLTEKNLQEDLLWFNRIFQDLQKSYEEYKTSPTQAETWLKQAKEIDEELSAFVLRIEDYQNSPLIKKYPNLAEKMKSLVNLWKNIFAGYSARIQGKSTSHNPDKIIPELQKIFNELSDIERIKSLEDAEIKAASLKQAQQDVKYLKTLYEELQQNLMISDTQKYIEWQSAWITKVQAIPTPPSWKPFSSGLALTYHYTILELIGRARIETEFRQAKDNATKQIKKAMLKRCQYKLQSLMIELEEPPSTTPFTPNN